MVSGGLGGISQDKEDFQSYTLHPLASGMRKTFL